MKCLCLPLPLLFLPSKVEIRNYLTMSANGTMRFAFHPELLEKAANDTVASKPSPHCQPMRLASLTSHGETPPLSPAPKPLTETLVFPPPPRHPGQCFLNEWTIFASSTERAAPCPLPSLPGAIFVPYTDLPHDKTLDPTPFVIKLFLGGLPDAMTRDDVAALATYCTSFPVCRENVILFQKARDVQKSGSCVIHLPHVEAAQRFMEYNKKIVCEDKGVRMHTDLAALAAYSRAVGAPHPLVIEPARARIPPPAGIMPCVPFPMMPRPSVPPPLGQRQIGWDMQGNPLFVYGA